MNRILKIILYVCIFSYTVFLLILYFFQNSLVYFPIQKDFNDCNYFTDAEKKIYKSTRFYERKGKGEEVIVFFHGNGGRACERQKIAEIFEKTKHSYLLVEYSGYAEGDTDVKPNIDNILQNVDDIEEYLRDSEYNSFMITGRSIGTGPASLLAGKIHSDKLLLISPYAQLYKVAADKYAIFPIKYFFTQNYNSLKYLDLYTGEVLIIHGSKDTHILQKYGKELFDTIGTKDKEFISVGGGNHNNELYIGGVEEKILDFLQQNNL